MEIIIGQDEFGKEYVTVNGEGTSPAITEVILNAIYEVEAIQEAESVTSGYGGDTSDDNIIDVPF